MTDGNARHDSPAPPSGLAVVITHYRNPDDLVQCLSAVDAATDRATTHVVVCDSDALPQTRALALGARPGTTYRPFDANVGYAALVNEGLRVTDSELVLVLNADVRITADAIATLVGHLGEHPDVGLAAPRLEHDDGSTQKSAFAFYRPTTVLYRRTRLARTGRGREELARFEAPARLIAAGHPDPIQVDWVLGAAMLVRRSAVQEVGPLDEAYFLYFEDVEWCLRFWQSNWRVVLVPSAVARHTLGRASSGHGLLGVVLNPLTRVHLRSARRFFRRNGRHVSRPLVRSRASSAVS